MSPADVDYAPAEDGEFLMVIDGVFFIMGRGLVATGCVQRGSVVLGDKLLVVGEDTSLDTSCAAIEMFNRELDRAVVGDCVGILLAGLAKGQVSKGMAVTGPA